MLPQLDNMTFKINHKNIDKDSGFLIVDGVCARSGIQQYLGAEVGLTGKDANAIVNVFRPPEEVKKSLDTFNGAVVTDDHPQAGLVIAGDEKLIKGNASRAAIVDSDKEIQVGAFLTITDPMLIKKALDGKKELSAGYTRDLVKESGEYMGEKYDYVQRNIRVNHVAVVDAARCGQKCSLNLDQSYKKGKLMKVSIDGRSVELDEDGVKSYIGDLKSQIDAEVKEKEALMEEKKESDASEVELKDQIEALKEQIKAKEEELAGMMSSGDAMAMVKSMNTVSTDAAALGVEVKGDSLDAMRKSVLASIVPAVQKDSVCKLEGDALTAVYDIQVATAKDSKAKMTKGYEGDANHTIVPTGNFANDLNAVAQAAREAAKQKGAK